MKTVALLKMSFQAVARVCNQLQVFATSCNSFQAVASICNQSRENTKLNGLIAEENFLEISYHEIHTMNHAT